MLVHFLVILFLIISLEILETVALDCLKIEFKVHWVLE